MGVLAVWGGRVQLNPYCVSEFRCVAGKKAEVKKMEEHDNKKRTAVWLTPGVIRRMDGWLEEDNCKTRSEFIEKALRFYMGYLLSLIHI